MIKLTRGNKDEYMRKGIKDGIQSCFQEGKSSLSSFNNG
jgi:hypothetical protein